MKTQAAKLHNNTEGLPHHIKLPQALLMDSCQMSLHGLRYLLELNLFKIGEIISLNKASLIPNFLRSNSPDIIIMELCGEGESVLEGLQILAFCKSNWPLVPLMVCTRLIDAHFIQQIKSLCVDSICYKYESLPAIEHCMQLTLNGFQENSPAINNVLKKHSNPLHSLTVKEIEVLSYLFDGCSVTTTASLMFRDIRTVSTHKRNAMAKMGYRNDNELFSRGKWMSRNGLFA
ncbi:LuxR C-terminal-related transcriptional regulator [Serratia sp. (in: enterobacteria)]|uniref:LuxR C-terminal-related transcriptional regulator n=1 Tax=Serratia sp. (in: enterobacteria) TaxID=616 RepID=UPI00398A4E51